RPCLPTRSWRKKTGPRLSSLMAIAKAIISGETASRPIEAPTRSKACLTTAEERVSSKRRTPISVTPCRSSNSTEEPTPSSQRGQAQPQKQRLMAVEFAAVDEEPGPQPRNQRAQRGQLEQLGRLVEGRLADQRLVAVIKAIELRPEQEHGQAGHGDPCQLQRA